MASGFQRFPRASWGHLFADKTVVAVPGRRSGFPLDTRTSNRTGGLLLWAERRTVLKGEKGYGLAKVYQPLFQPRQNRKVRPRFIKNTLLMALRHVQRKNRILFAAHRKRAIHKPHFQPRKALISDASRTIDKIAITSDHFHCLSFCRYATKLVIYLVKDV
jgi:hypothetical protein